ncbi:Cytochrome p450 [Nesidiocoris tenuis]|uniref:Cytochrome p450 n=1 Tax=Nesidiocoris tenuis TaxID=355587 RepID=A0ABN7B515_9HEMI|nr:Cytochrome p450 [Nesidiocoris tenuis]
MRIEPTVGKNLGAKMIVFQILFASCLLIFILWKWKVSYWQRRDIPCIEAKFPFGSIADIVLMRKTIGEVYDEIYYQLGDAPFGGIYRFWWPALFVKDPELIKTVFVKEFPSFHDNDYYVNPDVDPILGLNPFNSKGEKWKYSRGIVTPSLTILKTKMMLPGIRLVCQQMIDYLNSHLGEHLETYELMAKYSTDVVGCSAYGMYGNSFEHPDSTLRQMSSKMFDGSLKGNIALLCALYAPKLGSILKFKILTEEVNEYFVQVVRKAVEQRKDTNTVRDDFLQSLINENNEAEARGEPPVFSDKEMAAHSMTFFLDGFETTAILLGFILYELSLNALPQEKLRQELLKVGTSLDEFEFDKIHEAEYLDRVVMETLRMHPSGTSFARSCTQDITLRSADGREVFVEKGTPVILPMYSVHNDSKYFPNPDVFDPERFTEENKATRPQFSFFPFGGGPRTCPGNKFAMTMVKLAVVAVVLNFSLAPREIPRGKLELDPLNQFFHTAKRGLWVKFDRL